MIYDIWLHLNSRGAKNAALVSPSPLRASRWTDAGLEWRILDTGQEHYTIEVHGSTWTLDDTAWRELCYQYRVRHPRDLRPLAGRSYLSKCRPKLPRS